MLKEPDALKHNSQREFLFIFPLEGLLGKLTVSSELLHYLRYIGQIATHLETNTRNIRMDGKAN